MKCPFCGAAVKPVEPPEQYYGYEEADVAVWTAYKGNDDWGYFAEVVQMACVLEGDHHRFFAYVEDV